MPEDQNFVLKYILGISLGSASLGWALIQLNDANEPVGLLSKGLTGRHAVPPCGVRVFTPGVVGSPLDIQQGNDWDKSADRRLARLDRRQIRRKAARRRDLFLLLQRYGLLPEFDPREGNISSAERHGILNRLDKQITHKWSHDSRSDGSVSFGQLPLYLLRRAGLNHRLESYELGRVLYHLIQRRGYLSEEDDESVNADQKIGKVKAGISQLTHEMEAAQARTLGEYLAGLDPHQNSVRRRWTARWMFEQEFERLWSFQANYYPDLLTDELRHHISSLLFFQRPRSAKADRIANCKFEKNQQVAPMASLEAQRFRALIRIADLTLTTKQNPVPIPLSPKERSKLFDLLEREGDKTFAELREQLGLDGQVQFSLEKEGIMGIEGNRTKRAMVSVFSERWNEYSPDDQRRIARYWYTARSRELLVQRGVEIWRLDYTTANRWANLVPEGGYCSHSLRAIRKLMPLLLQGRSLQEAEATVYGLAGGGPSDKLPTVCRQFKSLRDPALVRPLSELRKVVNAIIREHGKPSEIRLELGRELKRSRKNRQKAARDNRQRQAAIEAAKARLLKDCGIDKPSRSDLEKTLLYEECGGICPYTGKDIPFTGLFQEEPEFDIQHIIPFSRYPDGTFQNMTLCDCQESRKMTRDRMPFETYGTNGERWGELLTRVKNFNNAGKMRRFMLADQSDLNEFINLRSDDQSYPGRLAKELLETLYRVLPQSDASGAPRPVVVSSGVITATLRRAWRLETILCENPRYENPQNPHYKLLSDHRYHAIDAITIALSGPRRVRTARSSVVSENDPTDAHHRQLDRSVEPWDGFVDSVRPHIERILVSHQPRHKISGALHKETIYGRPYEYGGREFVTVRRALSLLSIDDVTNIVDSAVRAAVLRKLEENGGDPKRFSSEKSESLPFLFANDGRKILIKKVRLREARSSASLNEIAGRRFVVPASIHHIELFCVSKEGSERWFAKVVNIIQANERCRQRVPVVQVKYEVPADGRFVFSLMKGDTVEMDYGGSRQVFRVTLLSSAGPILFTSINNSQRNEEHRKFKTAWTRVPNTLKQLRPQKVVIDILGRKRFVND